MTTFFEPATVDVGTWWTCPDWCAGDCYGGFAWRSDNGRTYTASRVHETVRYAAVGPSGDGAGMPVQVTVRVVRFDDYNDGAGQELTTLHVGDTTIEVTVDMAAAFAAVFGGPR